jgi:hypothetical protein
VLTRIHTAPPSGVDEPENRRHDLVERHGRPNVVCGDRAQQRLDGLDVFEEATELVSVLDARPAVLVRLALQGLVG